MAIRLVEQKEPLERDIQKAICDYLALRKHFFWRQNTGAIMDAKSGGYRSMPKYAMNGVPDIIVIKDGFFIGLEVKRPSTKQNPAQKEFQKKCKEAGGEYYVVRCVPDVQEIGL